MLLPGGLNERVVGSIKDNDLWSNTIEPSLRSRNPEVRTLLCYDGFGKGADRDASWTNSFSQILLGKSASVRTFSVSDPRRISECSVDEAVRCFLSHRW